MSLNKGIELNVLSYINSYENNGHNIDVLDGEIVIKYIIASFYKNRQNINDFVKQNKYICL